MTERNPVVVHCIKCSHGWIAAYVPMEMGKFAKLLKGLCCPNCAATSKDIRTGPKK